MDSNGAVAAQAQRHESTCSRHARGGWRAVRRRHARSRRPQGKAATAHELWVAAPRSASLATAKSARRAQPFAAFSGLFALTITLAGVLLWAIRLVCGPLFLATAEAGLTPRLRQCGRTTTQCRQPEHARASHGGASAPCLVCAEHPSGLRARGARGLPCGPRIALSQACRAMAAWPPSLCTQRARFGCDADRKQGRARPARNPPRGRAGRVPPRANRPPDRPQGAMGWWQHTSSPLPIPPVPSESTGRMGLRVTAPQDPPMRHPG